MNIKSITYVISFKQNANRSTIWLYLLQQKIEIADIVEFTVDKSGVMPKSLNPLRKQILFFFKSDRRWQCKQFFHTPMIRLNCVKEVQMYLLSINYLDQWESPNPIDPALYKNQDCLLWTIAHENLIFIQFTLEEKIMFENMFKEQIEIYSIDNDEPPSRIYKILG